MGSLKSILIIAGASIASLLLATTGAYFVLPLVAPGVGDQPVTHRSKAVSSDSASTRVDTMTSAIDSTRGGRRTTSDSSEAARDRSKSTSGNRAMAVQAALRDSIEDLKGRLENREKEVATLRADKKDLQTKLAAAERSEVKVTELSSALLDMRQRELAALLKNVEMTVLERLYQQASGGARTRLLRSMPPGRAANFVNKVVKADSTEEGSAEEALSEPLSSSN